MVAAETTITNRAGTIWAGFSTDGGATIQRGVAIDTVNVAGLIQLQGTEADGHIYGDINIASGNTIEVTEGKTWFEGTINGAEGTLDIFDGGKLVLCQEGWTARATRMVGAMPTGIRSRGLTDRLPSSSTPSRLRTEPSPTS